MSNRVFISGLGAVSSGGLSAQSTFDFITSGAHALKPVSYLQEAGWSHHLAGQIQDYQPRKRLPDKKLLKAISKQDVYGIDAGGQALASSGLLSHQAELASETSQLSDFNDHTGVYVGSPGNKYFQQYDFLPLLAQTQGDMESFGEQFMNDIHPMWLLRILPNNVLAYLGIQYQLKGVNHNVVNHATAGMQALVEAYRAIQTNQASRILVVAYDVGLDEQALFYYQKLGLISQHHLNAFDRSHNGTILAEGSAAVVLESEASLDARGGQAMAEVVSGFSRTECSHLFSIEASGHALAHLMQDTLNQADISAHQMNAIVAHANGNPKSDISESLAIQKLGLTQTPVTGFKWSIGHTLSASGLMDTVLSTLMLQAQLIPGLPYLSEPAQPCQALCLNATHRSIDVTEKPYTLILNRGFGGMNACLALKSCV